VIGPEEEFLVVGNWAVKGCNHVFSDVGIAVAAFDFDFIDLFVCHSRCERHDAIGVIDVGLVAVASTASTSIATSRSTSPPRL